LELQKPRDLDLESGYTAYRHASLIDLYAHTKFHWNRTKFLLMDVWTDGRTYLLTDGHFPLRVDLNIRYRYHHFPSNWTAAKCYDQMPLL